MATLLRRVIQAILALPSRFFPTHQTSGLPGFPAIDVFGHAGQVVGAPASGKVIKLSGSAPTASAAPGGPYGRSVYIQSSTGIYYLTHFAQVYVGYGQTVRQGQAIGTVANYAAATHGATPSHIHEGYHVGTSYPGLTTGRPSPARQQAGAGDAATDQAKFITGVSLRTGIDPRVLAAWMRIEGYTGKGYNYLNIGPGYSYDSVDNAIASTSVLILRLIGNLKGLTPGEAIARISRSKWDEGHYGGVGGPNLRRVFVELFGKVLGQGVLGSPYVPPDQASAVAATVGTGSAADIGSYDLGNAAHDISQATGIAALVDFLGKLTDPGFWIRALQIVGGAILGLLGLVLLARQIGLAQGPAGVARKAEGALT